MGYTQGEDALSVKVCSGCSKKCKTLLRNLSLQFSILVLELYDKIDEITHTLPHYEVFICGKILGNFYF